MVLYDTFMDQNNKGIPLYFSPHFHGFKIVSFGHRISNHRASKKNFKSHPRTGPPHSKPGPHICSPPAATVFLGTRAPFAADARMCRPMGREDPSSAIGSLPGEGGDGGRISSYLRASFLSGAGPVTG